VFPLSSYQTMKTPGDTSWFTLDRFGMFIHFGLYSVAARHEWIKTREMISEEKYDKYFDHFDPDLFDAKELARQAKAAGMKYAVFTAKHHEGFCLFDSKYTDYKSTNTPCGRDLVREYVDAFRAEGLRIGIYYSLLDWHHPHYTIDRSHPRRKDADAEQQDKGRDIRIYAQYMRDQLTELMSNYGQIDILWMDFSYPSESSFTPSYSGQNFFPWMQNRGLKGKEQWESEKLIETVRALQPNIIINNRADIEQDLFTPEQIQPTEWPRHPKTGELVVWESCQTFSGSWGYFRDEMTWKDPETLINLLINTVALGGNLIMNVGPTARGCLDRRAENAMQVYADWMRLNARAIHGCTMAEPEFKAPNGTALTQSVDGKRLYIHLKEYPFPVLTVPGLVDKVEYAQFLHDGSELKYYAGGTRNRDILDGEPDDANCLYFNLPPMKPDTLIPVIEVFLK